MKVSDFEFTFPEELISQRTAGKGKTNILHIQRQQPELRSILSAHSIISLFNEGDCLVVNNTKVIPARLFGHRASSDNQKEGQVASGKVEILLIRGLPESNTESSQFWEAWVKPGKSMRLGKTAIIGDITCTVTEILADGARILEFHCTSEAMQALLQEQGKIPLPPYIRRDSDAADTDDYQSVFAKYDGAVAAPTASLHFSTSMMDELRAKGVRIAEVTLHVGPGTFQNISVDDVDQHIMHSEQFELSQENADIINQCKQAGGRIISVGTTSTRVLETLADENGKVHAEAGETSIFIYPGYQWKIVDGLLTNFHWPKSTLVMLVASFLGHQETMDAYQFAIKNKLKLFSYGDGMLIL